MINRKIATFLFILFLVFPSCTGHFQEMNTDQSGITDEDMTVDFNNLGIPLGIIQQGIYFNYDINYLNQFLPKSDLSGIDLDAPGYEQVLGYEQKIIEDSERVKKY